MASNVNESFIIAFTAAYLVAVWFDLTVARHCAAWAVFFGWLELTMMIGKFPGIGIYIYMSFTVVKYQFHQSSLHCDCFKIN